MSVSSFLLLCVTTISTFPLLFLVSAPTTFLLSQYQLPLSLYNFGIGVFNYSEIVIFSGCIRGHQCTNAFEWRLPTIHLDGDGTTHNWTQGANPISNPYNSIYVRFAGQSTIQIPGTSLVFGAFPNMAHFFHSALIGHKYLNPIFKISVQKNVNTKKT